MKYLVYKKYIAVIIFIFASALFISCGAKSDASKKTDITEAKSKETRPSNSADPGGNTAMEVEITQKQYKAIKIELGGFERKILSNVLKATGYLSVPPQSKATITSFLGGTVKSIYVQEGNRVRKGQILASIVNAEFVKMQQDYLEAQAQLSFASANYTRQQELAKENVSAQKVLQEAESNYKTLLARVNSLKSQFSLIGIDAARISAENITSGINVRSPINGDVAKINVNLGLTVDPSTALMQIVDNSHLHLDLFVYEQDLPKVSIGQNVDFTLTNLHGTNFTAKIYSIGSAFENETKTIPVHAEINASKKELIEGMNVIGLINIGDNTVTAILSNAVVSFSGDDYIFIQKQDSMQTNSTPQNGAHTFKFERIKVKKGIMSGGYTEVTPLESIPETSKIVTNGSFYLMAILTNAGEEE